MLFSHTKFTSAKYPIIVSMNKKGLPASGNLMAGSIFKKIVDCLSTKE